MVSVLIFVTAAAAAAPAAQSRRAPNPAEVKALTRFIDAMKPVLDKFADASWQVENGDLDDDPSRVSISVHASVPLDDCLGGSRAWAVPQGSPRFNEELKPLYDRAQTLSDQVVAKYKNGQDAKAEMQQLDRLNQQIKQLNRVTMDVCANSPNVEAAALPANVPSLVPGAIAHKVDAGVCGGQDPACYVLVFGDWKAARRSGDRYDYHFAHAAATPFIENVVIKLHGADDRIQALLKTIDWSRVNQGLTN